MEERREKRGAKFPFWFLSSLSSLPSSPHHGGV
jgi:hypothetical protein